MCINCNVWPITLNKFCVHQHYTLTHTHKVFMVTNIHAVALRWHHIICHVEVSCQHPTETFSLHHVATHLSDYTVKIEDFCDMILHHCFHSVLTMMNHNIVRLLDFFSHVVFKNTQIKQILQTGSVSKLQFGDDHPTRGNRKCHNANHVHSWENIKHNHTTKTDPTT